MTEVEVYEVLSLVGDEGAKVTSNNTVPCWALAVIELRGMLLVHVSSTWLERLEVICGRGNIRSS